MSNSLSANASSNSSPPLGVVVVSPTSGSTAGGALVSVNGQNFGVTGSTTVAFVNRITKGSTAGTQVTVNATANSLTVVQPALSVGTYDLLITTPQGTSAVVPTDQFVVGPVVSIVTPAGGPAAGGTQVTLLGANFTGATAVGFGSTQVTSGLTVGVNGTSLTVTSPALSLGAYQLTVVTPSGTSLPTSAETFTAGATVTGLSPTSVSATSATTLTISGAELTGATQVTIGSQTISSGLTVDAAGTTLTLTVPSGLAAGSYAVIVTTAANGTSLPSTAAQLLVAPVTVTIANQTGLGAEVPIYAAVFGQLAFTSGGALDAHPSSASLSTDTLVECFFNAAGQYAPTAPLAIGYPPPTFNTVPTFALRFVDGVATLPLPHIFLNAARIVFGVGKPPQATIVNPAGGVAAPALGNPTDPNQTVLYDFIEFTLNQDDVLFLNTSQVDQVGIPLTVALSPVDPNVPGGVGIVIPRDQLFGTAATSFSTYLAAVGSPAFAECATQSGQATIGGSSYPYRLLAPADLLQLDPSSSLATYFDAELAALFATSATLTLMVPNPNAGNSSGANTVNPGDAALSSYSFSGSAAGGLLTFTTQVTTPSGAQTVSLVVGPVPASGGSAMVFACNGIFADNVPRYGSPGPSLTSMSALQSSLLANIENQLVSALNRGIANAATTAYPDTTAAWAGAGHLAFYPASAAANFYAGYLHATVAGVQVSVGGLAYGFAYDDQGGQSSTQAVTDPQAISIALRPWA